MVDSALMALRTWAVTEAQHFRADRQDVPLKMLSLLERMVSGAFKLVQYALLRSFRPPAVLMADRYELLRRAVAAAPQSGLWLEFGVWEGASINYIADQTGQPIYGFDSFEGLPEDWMPGLPAGSFSTGGRLPSVRPTVTLVRGLFRQTLPAFLAARPSEPVGFLHVDCDLYSSSRDILTTLGPRIDRGTVIVFDEFCGLMPDNEARAWREFRRQHGIEFRPLGCSMTGSMALLVTGRAPRTELARH